MQENEFKQLLLSATDRAKHFALNYIKDELPAGNVYSIRLNASYDDPALAQFDLYPEDSGKMIEFADAETVIKTLLRKGKVPVWIDISVTGIQKGRTVLNLLCAGRYTGELQEMYYHQRETGPFGIKSPILPISYRDGAKFWLPKTGRRSIISRLFRRRR